MVEIIAVSIAGLEVWQLLRTVRLFEESGMEIEVKVLGAGMDKTSSKQHDIDWEQERLRQYQSYLECDIAGMQKHCQTLSSTSSLRLLQLSKQDAVYINS